MKPMAEWEFSIYMQGFSAYQFSTGKLNAYRSALWRRGWEDAIKAEREVASAEEREYQRTHGGHRHTIEHVIEYTKTP